MSKPLTQLVPDLREALEKGLEEAAEKVVMDLKEDGPYWTGFFESLWEVNPGNTAIKANIKNPLKVPKKPKTKEITSVDIPESPTSMATRLATGRNIACMHGHTRVTRCREGQLSSSQSHSRQELV